MKNPGYIFIFIQITHIQTEEQREDAGGSGKGGKGGEGDLQKMGTPIDLERIARSTHAEVSSRTENEKRHTQGTIQ